MKTANKGIYLTLGVLAFALSAVARAAPNGGSSSGGGNVIVCFQTTDERNKIQAQHGVIKDEDLVNIESIDTLEIYDMKTHYSPLSDRTLLPMKYDDPVASVNYIYNWYLKNISFHRWAGGNELGEILPLVIARVNDQKNYLNRPLRVQDDSSEVVNYDNSDLCTKATVAIQNGDRFFELTIDARLWNSAKFSTLSKVALIFHEALYRIDRLDNNATSSLAAQRTNEVLLSTREGESRAEWASLLNSYDVISAASLNADYISRVFQGGWLLYSPNAKPCPGSWWPVPCKTEPFTFSEYLAFVLKYAPRPENDQFVRYDLESGLVHPELVAMVNKILSDLALQPDFDSYFKFITDKFGVQNAATDRRAAPKYESVIAMLKKTIPDLDNFSGY